VATKGALTNAKTVQKNALFVSVWCYYQRVFPGMERELSALLSGELKKPEREKVALLLEYLRNNSGRLNYAKRLAQGRAIGSGLIEGACKSMVGKRVKQPGACWRVRRANRIAILASLLYSKQWENAWKKEKRKNMPIKF